MSEYEALTPAQVAEVNEKVERIRKTGMKSIFAHLAAADPTLRDTFEKERANILASMFPSGDGRDDLGLGWNAARQLLDEVSEALTLTPREAHYPRL